MNKLIITCLILLLDCHLASARSGCCSWHGGVNHCDSDSGQIACNDGTFSPSCTCEPNSNNPNFSAPIPTPQPQQQYPSQPQYPSQSQNQSEQLYPAQSQYPSQSFQQNQSTIRNAMASCMARNKSTNQYFSATGNGDTQASATQDAQGNVLKNCQQTSSTPDDCIITSCSSSQY